MKDRQAKLINILDKRKEPLYPSIKEKLRRAIQTLPETFGEQNTGYLLENPAVGPYTHSQKQPQSRG